MKNTPDSADTLLSVNDLQVRQKDIAGDFSQDDLLESLDESTNNTIHAGTPPDVLGEQAMSGSDPDPESDDDTLAASHQVGLRLDEDYGAPKELNTAADVAAAERHRRGY